MTIVFKDFKRDVLRIDSIPSTSLDNIKEWLNTTDLKYYESRLNLNWRPILKTITDDPEKFIEDGGWEFLNMEVSDSDSENSVDSDQGYEPSDVSLTQDLKMRVMTASIFIVAEGVEESGNKMERVTKLPVILTMFLVVLAWDVEGGRTLKVDHPQNYFGSFGGTGSVIPSPFGPTIALGPSGFCSFPGVGCVRVRPILPGVGVGSPP
ncbi:hypothetical protein GH714_006485 [Hevea brasiliensis]|uniref:FACT complex subunit n=1 Tax=Hevea brasiliensis TaxID=3981 RepID=A0A6A6NFZ4_HEVBR|nr:hypothetical protein GH714_006485 [Hevea brasiliensis]